VLYERLLANHAVNPCAGIDVAPAQVELSRLTTLTPGDFAAVARRLGSMGRKLEPLALVAELRAEVEAKEPATRPVGFSTERVD
jgi:hypothetical protein